MGMVKVKSITMRIDAFRNDKEIELKFPEGWDITECRMAGHDRPALSGDGMRSALRNTIGTPRLSEMAKGAKKVCILFDDIAKPTPIGRILPFVLEELHAGGVTDEQIRLVCAPGTHRPMIYPEFVAKLGRDIVEKYPVYNHSVGRTRWMWAGQNGARRYRSTVSLLRATCGWQSAASSPTAQQVSAAVERSSCRAYAGTKQLRITTRT